MLGGEPRNGVDVEVEPEPLCQGLPRDRVRLGAGGEKFAQASEVALETTRRDDLQYSRRRCEWAYI